MSDTLKFANEEFNKLLSNELNITNVKEEIKYYYFLQGFRSGLNYEDKKIG